ncbi:hypothetical protein ACIQAC_10355 [Streptomyces sp. NPDC088387]|uniref:hypothetical protein n=1 Tax=Streptomyces sp. NPDC088387 TaxID=3365859 RepID=UPI0038041487
MANGSIRGKGCLIALGLALCWMLVGAGIPMGLTVAGMGVYDKVTADRPIKCGDDVMPDDDTYHCLGPYSPSTYEGLVEERREEVARAPYFIFFGSLAAVLGVVAWFVIRRYVRAPMRY